MMEIALLYVVTVAVFLAIDYFGLTYMIRPLFERFIGDLLTESFRLGPALIFYLFYMAGVVFFVSLPALEAGAPGQALWKGVLIGAMAYGTYEFTNYATIKAWDWRMVVVDGLWGSALTGVAAWAGVLVVSSL